MKNVTSANRLLAAAGRLARDDRGLYSVELALLLFPLLALTFGVLEFARVGWVVNATEKATQVGVRYAVESDPVPANWTDFDAMEDLGLEPLDDLTTEVIGAFIIRCTAEGCVCVTGCGDDGAGLVFNGDDFGFDQDAFNAIVAEMQRAQPSIRAEHVAIDYAHIGMGFAARPGPDIVPRVTVRLQDLAYDFFILDAFVGLPDLVGLSSFDATLTAEDLHSAGESG